MATLSDLKQDHKNARKRTQTSASLLQESLQRYGPARSIVIDEDNRILAGNGTVEAAINLGIDGLRIIDAAPDELIAVRRTGLSEDQKVGLALADNRTADLAEWDAEMLQQLSKEHDIAPWFEDEDVEALLEQVEKLDTVEGKTDPDEVPEAPEEPITKPGDLWILGNHRLLCGDSTNIQHVERLMDGQKADIVFTDPPYGVCYDHTARPKPGKKNHGTIENDELTGQQLQDFLASAFNCADIASKPNCAAYIWLADKYLAECLSALLASSFCFNQTLIWKKPMLLGRSRYQWAHEICLFAVKGSPFHTEDRTKTTIWDFGGYDKSKNQHPTQKPTFLAKEALGNSSMPGQIVLDLFGGSGSTLIAAQETGRHARLMELDPAYCDVIVKRWEDFTGNTAICHPSDSHFANAEDDI
jgi:site-specific DNA-methyltransferase (adenine-specific)